MERRTLINTGIVITAFAAVFIVTGHVYGLVGSFSQTEPGFEEEEPFIPDLPQFIDPYANWTRPDGPLRVGIQVGHWFAQDAPDEQEGLRDNTGAAAAGVTEWETNLKIAQEVKKLLEAENIVVDLLPTTIPPKYWADVFISIHADGNADTSVKGYKIAAPRRDRSGNAQRLSDLIEQEYGKTTGMIIDPNITRNMRGYYAFNSRRYEHSIHPMTPGAIVETGFITNASDRRIIVNNPKKSAEGIANAILLFLKETAPLQNQI
jgi:N-acetylmuramoyl-L-alanine amidase